MQWPAIGLNQYRPVDLIETPDGLKQIEEFLDRLQYGVYRSRAPLLNCYCYKILLGPYRSKYKSGNKKLRKFTVLPDHCLRCPRVSFACSVVE